MRRSAEFMVGVFVLAALVIFTVFTIRVGKFSWKEPERWTIRFEDVSGLKEGDPVLALGARVGKVKKLQFKTDHVLAHLELYEHVDLYEDYELSIRAPSILASYHVFILPGDPSKPKITSYQNLRGRSAAGLFAEAIEKAIKRFSSEEGSLGKLIVGEKGYNDLIATLESAHTIAKRLEGDDAPLGKMIIGQEALTNLKNTLANADKLSADLAKGDGRYLRPAQGRRRNRPRAPRTSRPQ